MKEPKEQMFDLLCAWLTRLPMNWENMNRANTEVKEGGSPELPQQSLSVTSSVLANTVQRLTQALCMGPVHVLSSGILSGLSDL